MKTRKEVCEKIVADFENKQGGVRAREQDVFSSSMLAVAMEYLELIKDSEIKTYCASRDGILTLKGLEGTIEPMTLREFLKTLPEKEDDERKQKQK